MSDQTGAGPPYQGEYPPLASPPRRPRGPRASAGRDLYPQGTPRPPTSPAGGSRHTPPPPPSTTDDRKVRSPDGRWELDVETGEWTPVSGAPIGVPSDYRPVVPGRGPAYAPATPGEVAGAIPDLLPQAQFPQYFEGDEYSIGAGLSPETIAGIQTSLQEAGFIPVDATLPYGTWDTTTANAMQEILAVANVQGLDWQVALDQSVSNAIAATGGYLTQARAEAEAARLPTPLGAPVVSNPDELRAVVQQVARRTIGRNADEAFVNQFVNDWQAYESSRFYNQKWDPETRQWVDQNTVQPISPEGAVEKAVLGDYGDEAGAMSTLNVMNMFEGIVTKPAV